MTAALVLALGGYLAASLPVSWRRRHRRCPDWWAEQSARVLCATGPVRLHD